MTSAALQVLISLQAMVFVKDPYFNEPGYESTHGTAEGNRLTARYNDSVLRNNIKYGMRAPLSRPLMHPHGVFRDVLRLHWTRKRRLITDQLAAAEARLTGPGDGALIKEVRRVLGGIAAQQVAALMPNATPRGRCRVAPACAFGSRRLP